MPIELTEPFLAKIAGWEAVKQARSLLERGNVLSSNWTPPILKGVVQEGSTSYRAGLAIKDSIDIENMCSCRQSRQWGTICAHSVAVGLHHLKPAKSDVREKPKVAPAPKSFRRLPRSTTGEPAEISVILPPNLPQALAKDKVMLFFEGQAGHGRLPLDALPLTGTYQFSAPDAALLDLIEEIAGDTPNMILVDGAGLAKVLARLAGHPRVTLGRTTVVEIENEPARLKLQAALEAGGEILLRPASESAPGKRAVIAGDSTSWVFGDHRIQRLPLPKSCRDLLSGPVRLSRRDVPQFLSRDWPKLLAACDVAADFSINDFSFEPLEPRFRLSLKGGLARLEAELACAYGDRVVVPGKLQPDESFWLADAADPTRYSTRDLPAEQAAVARLLRCGFTGPEADGRYHLAGQNAVLPFFAREYPRMEKEWQVSLEERLERSTGQNLERIEPQFQVTSSGVQWFDVDIAYQSKGGVSFSAADIQRLLLSGQSHTRLRNGKFAIIDTGAVEELQQVLLDCEPQQHEAGYRFKSAQAGFLESTLREQGWRAKAPQEWLQAARQQAGGTQLECPPLGDLENVLRPYQKTGVGWLHFLRRNGFGGILADEMGLGKTLQALAFLSSIKTALGGTGDRSVPLGGSPALPMARRDACPALVICPTSLVFNWVAEARKFTPELKVLALHGPERHARFDQIPEHDLIVTSYALVRRDAERYRSLQFDTVVLDEAQHIKNRQTQNAQAVKAIRAEQRVVLTGTPLENSVLDLWSIFDFLMPGYLGSARDFRERYEVPVTRDRNAGVQARLARRLRPFILRRLKRDVAKELPEKLEQVSFCDMTGEQSAVYREVLEATRREIVNAVDAQGLQKSRMLVLTALLRLRQICCDLRLLKLKKLDEGGAGAWTPGSGKFELFGELLEEVIDGGHRVLVFSQFVGMLQLLKEYLEAGQVEYCYLDGSTANRGAVVERFQGNPGIPVFLISLKAGGVGLNLTGADTVIHFDPWWNPAVEDQATDRAHRIGQTRVVTSYKLITRGTIEEKILTLQNRKRELIQATLSGEEQFAESLTWEEIQELLS